MKHLKAQKIKQQRCEAEQKNRSATEKLLSKGIYKIYKIKEGENGQIQELKEKKSKERKQQHDQGRSQESFSSWPTNK